MQFYVIGSWLTTQKCFCKLRFKLTVFLKQFCSNIWWHNPLFLIHKSFNHLKPIFIIHNFFEFFRIKIRVFGEKLLQYLFIISLLKHLLHRISVYVIVYINNLVEELWIMILLDTKCLLHEFRVNPIFLCKTLKFPNSLLINWFFIDSFELGK